ncbi:MAG: hypothetical protein GYA23_07520, partial [Methanomicrobiales archaeon]|nr:hypothetical protein [Methanomicrobiales archaeon]
MRFIESIGTVPGIGAWLNRLSVRRIARKAAGGDVAAVRELAEVFCSSPDPKAASLAENGLMHLVSSEQRDCFLHECLLWDTKSLVSLAARLSWRPEKPGLRAVWDFCTNDTRAGSPYSEHDIAALGDGYEQSDEAVRAQVQRVARRRGECSVLARALAGTQVNRNAARWSYTEWEIIVKGISMEARWDDLWILATLAPLPLAARAVRALVAAGWSPEGDVRLIWEYVRRNLPDEARNTLPREGNRRRIGRPASQVSRMCFSRDGSLFATGCCDGTISVWRTGTGELVSELSLGRNAIRFLAFSLDTTVIVSAGDDGIIQCNHVASRSLLWSGEKRGEITALSLDERGETILAGDTKGALTTLDIRTGRVLSFLSLHASPVTCISPAEERPAVFLGHADGMVTVHREGAGDTPCILPGNNSPVRHISCDGSRNECLVVYDAGYPALMDLTSGKKIRA